MDLQHQLLLLFSVTNTATLIRSASISWHGETTEDGGSAGSTRTMMARSQVGVVRRSVNNSTSLDKLRYLPPPVSSYNNSRDGAGGGSDGTVVEGTTSFSETGGHYLDNDEMDNSFSDLQTLIAACVITLILLVFSLIVAFVVRMLWRKYRRDRECRAYEGVLSKDDSSAPLSSRHGLTLSADELKSTESQFSLDGHVRRGDAEVGAGAVGGGGGGSTGSPMYSGASSRTTNHASANGSIITMTLKNNHLIVETEERNDLVEDSRETTMRYSPSSHDGVFVVEVQQGVRRTPKNYSSVACSSPEDVDDSLRSTDQRAIVHRPPAGVDSDDVAAVKPADDSRRISACTGLSQSDLSESSNGSCNPNYRYGNQQGYDSGHYGYPIYGGYSTEPSNKIYTQPSPSNPDKPIITSAIYKETSPQLVKDVHQRRADLVPASSIDVGSGPLLSDIQAKERCLQRKEAAVAEEPSPQVVKDAQQRRVELAPAESIDTGSLASGPLLSDIQAKERCLHIKEETTETKAKEEFTNKDFTLTYGRLSSDARSMEMCQKLKEESTPELKKTENITEDAIQKEQNALGNGQIKTEILNTEKTKQVPIESNRNLNENCNEIITVENNDDKKICNYQDVPEIECKKDENSLAKDNSTSNQNITEKSQAIPTIEITVENNVLSDEETPENNEVPTKNGETNDCKIKEKDEKAGSNTNPAFQDDENLTDESTTENNLQGENIDKTSKNDAGKELYNQIKETTKNILPVTSPKFEKLQNDASPSLESKETEAATSKSEVSDIKNEEYENKAFVSTDDLES